MMKAVIFKKKGKFFQRIVSREICINLQQYIKIEPNSNIMDKYN